MKAKKRGKNFTFNHQKLFKMMKGDNFNPTMTLIKQPRRNKEYKIGQ